MQKKVLLMDCDPGHDDAIALLLVLASEAFAVRAVTVCAGNQTVDKTLENAKRIISLTGQRPRVARGVPQPLVRKLIVAPSVHGESGIDGPALPPSDLEEEPGGAVQLLYSEIMQAKDPVTLVTTGPLSNVARLLLAHPDAADRIERISIMGGAVYGGNWTPAAEFNIYVDPEAADIVFRSGVPILMSGLDVTHKALIYPEEVEQLRALGGTVPRITAELLDFFFGFHKAQGFAGSPLHDACAVACLLAPELFQTKDYYVCIETQGRYTRGATVADVTGVTKQPPNATVCVDVCREGFFRLLLDTMRYYKDKEMAV